jgi:hypothetical protein
MPERPVLPQIGCGIRFHFLLLDPGIAFELCLLHSQRPEPDAFLGPHFRFGNGPASVALSLQ